MSVAVKTVALIRPHPFKIQSDNRNSGSGKEQSTYFISCSSYFCCQKKWIICIIGIFPKMSLHYSHVPLASTKLEKIHTLIHWHIWASGHCASHWYCALASSITDNSWGQLCVQCPLSPSSKQGWIGGGVYLFSSTFWLHTIYPAIVSWNHLP